MPRIAHFQHNFLQGRNLMPRCADTPHSTDNPPEVRCKRSRWATYGNFVKDHDDGLIPAPIASVSETAQFGRGTDGATRPPRAKVPPPAFSASVPRKDATSSVGSFRIKPTVSERDVFVQSVVAVESSTEANSRVQCRKQFVFHKHFCTGNCVHQRRFSGIGGAHERETLHGVTTFALLGFLNGNVCQFFFQSAILSRTKRRSVSIWCFARTFRADTAELFERVRPSATGGGSKY